MTEYATLMELLRQQKDHLDEHFASFKAEANGRFDRVEVRLDKVDERLEGVETQVRLTNGTVKTHTAELAALNTPERQPALTKAEARFAQRLAVKVGAAGSAAWWAVQWVLTNWGHLFPLLTSKVN